MPAPWEANGQPVPSAGAGIVPAADPRLIELAREWADLDTAHRALEAKQLDGEVILARRGQLASRQARAMIEAEELAALAGERRIMPWAELAAQPPPQWLMPGLLTAGVYGLAGPPEAGKSLLCRDWLCQLAASGQNVLYALSEGQHDLADRFGAHPLIGQAGPRLRFLDAPLSLASAADVRWLAGQCLPHKVAMICFDMVYGFGLPDDTGTGDVAPVLGGAKRLATDLGACILLTGHPGHGGGRRFRGSSMWRGAFDGEFHMADGLLSCEKHKYTDKRRLSWAYEVAFPHLRPVNVLEAAGRQMSQQAEIEAFVQDHPDMTDAEAARQLAVQLGLGADYLRRKIRRARTAGGQG